jgi:altronate hydrolase
MTPPDTLHIHPQDNVVVAVRGVGQIPIGHKIALRAIAAGESIIKFGHAIGRATEDIAAGDWVHSHNLTSDLKEAQAYAYHPERPIEQSASATPTWLGYRRGTRGVGTRNEIWILNTVGCVNVVAERIARIATARFKGEVDGIYTFSHPYGCSQLGADLDKTRRLLASLMRHPNAGGVLVLGLGCESNQMKDLLAEAERGGADPQRIRFFNTQEVSNEVEAGVNAVDELVRLAAWDRRQLCSIGELVLGLKCGGSDAFSGLTANPLVGRIAEAIVGWGGIALLSEVPEMFGAEQSLMNRAVDEPTYRAIVSLIDRFKRYYTEHHQPIHENPSPGNKQGGITTLEEKSLGAVQKGGRAPIAQVLNYGTAASLERSGLALVEAPGNDAVSSTALAAAGATMVLFTSGRGTPLGTVVPTLKIATHTEIAIRKPHWFDCNAGKLLEGYATMDALTSQLLTLLLNVASGRQLALNEINEQREIAIWKDGVTL